MTLKPPSFSKTQPSPVIFRKDRNTSEKTEVRGGNFFQHINKFDATQKSSAIAIRLLNTELSTDKLGTDDARNLCEEMARYDVLRSKDGLAERNALLLPNGYGYNPERNNLHDGYKSLISRCVDELIRLTKTGIEDKNEITDIQLNDIHGGGISPELVTRLVGYYNRAVHIKNSQDGPAFIPQDFFNRIYSNGWFSTHTQDQKQMTKNFTEGFGQWLTKAGVAPANVEAIKQRFQENYMIDATNNNSFVCRSKGPTFEEVKSNAFFKKESDRYSFAIDFSNPGERLVVNEGDNKPSALSNYFKSALDWISQCWTPSKRYNLLDNSMSNDDFNSMSNDDLDRRISQLSQLKSSRTNNNNNSSSSSNQTSNFNNNEDL